MRSSSTVGLSGWPVAGYFSSSARTSWAPSVSKAVSYTHLDVYKRQEVMLPLMLACITGFVIAQRIRPDSVYAKSLASNRIARETLKAAPVLPADKPRDS